MRRAMDCSRRGFAARVTGLLAISLMIVGCARGPRELFLSAWNQTPAKTSRINDPTAQLKDEARSHVEANRGARAWSQLFARSSSSSGDTAQVAADGEADQHPGHVLSAIINKRDPKADPMADPFLNAAEEQNATRLAQSDLGPADRSGAQWTSWNETEQPDQALAERVGHTFEPLPPLPDETDEPSLPDWAAGAEPARDPAPTTFVDGQDSRMQRLRNAMTEDANAATPTDAFHDDAHLRVQRLMEQARRDMESGNLSSAYRTVLSAEELAALHAVNFDPGEEQPAELARRIRKEIEAILRDDSRIASQTGSHLPDTKLPEQQLSGQLAQDFPWSAATTGPKTEAGPDAAPPAVHQTELDAGSHPLDGTRSPEVEFLPPPPVTHPLTDSSDAAPSVDSPLVGSNSPFFEAPAPQGVPAAAAWDGPPADGRNQDRAVPAIVFDGFITPAGTEDADRPRDDRRLAMIVPHGRSAVANQPPPRVVANAPTVLPTQPPRAQHPLGPISEVVTHPRPSAPPVSTTDVFEEVQAPQLSDVEPAADDWTSEAAVAPLPPAETSAETPRALVNVAWEEDAEMDSGEQTAALPLPVLFGLSVGAAFLIGLAFRRKGRAEAR